MTDQNEDQDVELDEDIEEAHDPKNAEQQSFAANDKAEVAVKGKAKSRKGDKANSDPMQKVAAAPAAMKAEDVEFNGDFSEDLNALVESEATLSDEFKAKTAVIFEAAVKSKLSEEINRLETEYVEQLAEEVSTTKADLVEKIDSYLNYVVENWMEENKLAVQSGLRSEIAEDFMEKLKDVFTESYIEVPESKIDLVDELATVHEELEEQFNDAVANCLTKLAGGISFESEEDFATKVATIKESYFKTKSASSSITEDLDDDTEDDSIELTGSMADYVAALRKTTK